jgi:hypothetical protein
MAIMNRVARYLTGFETKTVIIFNGMMMRRFQRGLTIKSNTPFPHCRVKNDQGLAICDY